MRNFFWATVVIVSTVLMAGSAFAGSVTVNFDAGTTNQTTALTGFSTDGSMMGGMKITAYFSDNSSQTETWATTGTGAGGASGTGWSLGESGDTFGGNWTLSNTGTLGITRLLIDAGPGNTVLDTTFGGATGTPGSELGMDFAVVSGGDPYAITATYSNLVALTGFAPVGDLYRDLDIAFDVGLTGSLVFNADTDNIKFAGDIAPVPIPGALLLLGTGLLSLAGYGYRRKQDV